MSSKPIQSRVAFSKAEDALKEIKIYHDNYWSDKMDLFRDAWSDFLIYTSRVYTKSEQESKTIPGNWFSSWKGERRTDELLCWFWHARNVDEHGLALVYEYDPGEVKVEGEVGKPFGLQPIVTERGIVGVRALTPWTKIVSSRQPEYLLIDVTDRGVTYPSPRYHKGSIIDPKPYPAAKTYLSYIENMVLQLESSIP